MPFDQTEAGELVHRTLTGAEPADVLQIVEVEAFGEAQAHQQGLVGFLRLAQRRTFQDAVFLGFTRSSQRSGSFSVRVAWRAPSMSTRPCAPGPMPAYSP